MRRPTSYGAVDLRSQLQRESLPDEEQCRGLSLARPGCHS